MVASASGPIVIQAEEFTITDANGDTVVRDPQNPEIFDPDGVGKTDGLWNGFTGTGYVDMGLEPGDQVAFAVEADTAGPCVLTVRYANSGSADRPMTVSVNGAPLADNLAFASTGTGVAGWTNWTEVQIEVSLVEGTNEIAFANVGPTGPNLDSVALAPVEPFEPVLVQAEDGTITLSDDPDGDATVTLDRDRNDPATAEDPTGKVLDLFGLRSGYGGTGYTDFGDDPGDSLTVDLEAPRAGTFDLHFRYASGGTRPLDLAVDGSTSRLSFPSTAADGIDAFDNWQFLSETVTLEAGANTIDLSIPADRSNGPNLDLIQLTETGVDPNDLDVSADQDNDLTLTGPTLPVSASEALALTLNVTGIDPDVELVEISLDGGATRQAVMPTSDGDVIVDASTLAAGPNTAAVIVTDESGNDASTTFEFVIDDEFLPFTLEAEDAILVSLIDLDGDTEIRDPDNPEDRPPSQVGPDGLWDGFFGSGYVDLGSDIGDGAAFSVIVPEAGAYALTVRYANGSGDGADRPMDVLVDNIHQGSLDFATTGADDVDGWSNWADTTIQLDLQAGTNEIQLSQSTDAGPNIDNFTLDFADIVSPPPPPPGDIEPGPRDVILLNFQDGTEPVVADYLVANFDGFQSRANGLSYGWVTEASVRDGDLTSAVPIAAQDYPANAIDTRPSDIVDPRLQGYARFDLPSYPARTAFELALDDGWYEVTVAVGDTGGPNNSDNQLLIEGVLGSSFVPVDLYKTELVTAQVEVTDGRLTLSAPDGTITEVQYLEVQELPDLTPTDGREAPLDYASFDAPIAISGFGSTIGEVELDPATGFASGVDPTSDIILSVEVVPGRGGILLESLSDGSIQLVETLTGETVPFDANTTGGFDALTIAPIGGLAENTSYTLAIAGAQDRGPIDQPTAATREFQQFSTSFLTGEAEPIVQPDLRFRETIELDGFDDGAGGFTSVELSPDGQHLYVSTITGQIRRWAIDADGALIPGSEETFEPQGDFVTADGRRSIIGLTFDPDDPGTLWITDNWPIPLSGRSNDVPVFSGRLSQVTLGDGGSLEDATVEPYITNLPRSNGDHVTNSIEFGPDGMLYLLNGSQSAMGAPDSAWGFRPEEELSAAVLEVDPDRIPPPGGFDVRTRGGADYDPAAPDAVLSVFASGTRNAYDLVWHSNGFLYVPTNGSAAGGNVPDDPTTPSNEAVTSVSRQDDYLFRVEPGGYYGHPNPTRGEYVMNGGNPTGGVDPNEVVAEGTNNGYGVGIEPDPNYRIESAFPLGQNRSPNGAIEYTFDNELQETLLFTEFSVGDDIRAVQFDLNGFVATDFVLTNTEGELISYTDPLDLNQNPETGQLYLITLNRRSGASQLVRLDPEDGVSPPPPPPPPPDGGPVVGENFTFYEAEFATLQGAVFVPESEEDRDAEGEGFVEFDGTGNQSVTWMVAVEEAGTYEIGFRYALAVDEPDRPLDIAVNGTNLGPLNFVGQSTFPDDIWFVQATEVSLNAGSNMIMVTAPGAVGPDLDQLQVANLPEGAFEPTFAAIDGSGRIELESGDTARTTDAVTAEFYFNVAEDGIYALEVAANADAPDGQDLWFFLNGEGIDQTDFPGVGEAGEEVVFVELETGTDYELRVVSGAPGADELDYLDVNFAAVSDDEAEIAVQSLDPAFLDDRLHFSFIENNASPEVPRLFKEFGVVNIANEGPSDLAILDAELSGPFDLANPSLVEDRVLVAGESVNVRINFDRSEYSPPTGTRDEIDEASGLFEGALTLTTNDADSPEATVDLVGFWQQQDEAGFEPNVNEVWEVFGFGNFIEGLPTLRGGENAVLDDFDLYRAVDETEVLSQYWRIADGVEAATITHLAAFGGIGSSTVGIHNPGNKNNANDEIFWNHSNEYNQSILPRQPNNQFGTETFDRDDIPDAWAGDDIFGIEIAGLSTDPFLNPSGGGTPPPDAAGIERGYTVRMFQALDANGNEIPNTFLAIQDFTGINYDYNDNMVLVEGIEPVTGTVGEAGIVEAGQPNGNFWHTVSFAEELDNPAVVMGPATDNGAQPLNIRVRNVDQDGFEWQMDEWDYLDGNHTGEAISWLAVESGQHFLLNGQTIMAGTGVVSDDPQSVVFDEEFASNPALLTQVTSDNDPAAVAARADNVSMAGFDVFLQEEEAADGVHGDESLGWIAFTPGGGAGDGQIAGLSGTSVTNNPSTFDFDGTFAEQPAFLADMQTANGRETAVVRAEGLWSTTAATVSIEEEQSSDAEVRHQPENVGFVAIETGPLLGQDTDTDIV